jgi:hypothetical protein
MRDFFFKLLPYLTGAVLGFLVFFPPAGFLAIGPWRPVVLGVLMIVGLLAATGLQLAINLPENVAIDVLPPEAPPPDIARLLESYRSLGFELLDPPVRIHLRPSCFVWVLTNRELGCWGTVFSTGTVPRRVGYDVISLTEGERASLTSLSDPAAGVLPLAPGHFKQVLKGASPAELVAFHREALRFLIARGVRFEPAKAGGVAERIRRSFVLQRRVVAANPVKAAALVLWRATTRTSPYSAPVASQRITETSLRQLQQGLA